MKILYCGNFTASFSTETHIAATLEGLGHEVVRLQENMITPYGLTTRLERPDFDLFLFTRTWGVTVQLQHLEQLRGAGIPSVSFHLDKYTSLQRDGGIGTDPFWLTDHVFSPEGSSQAAAIFASRDINQRYLPAGVFDQECYLADPLSEFQFDVVFVGGGSQYLHPEWPYRREMVGWLQQTYGPRFGKFGYPERTVRGHELNQLYASAKVVIGDTLCKDFFDSHYFSDRQFEVTGRGGFLITPYIAGITDFFVDRKEAVFYAFGNWQQLKFMIDYYLAHDGERESIRLGGHERTKRDHTYRNRMEQMLGVLRAEGAIK